MKLSQKLLALGGVTLADYACCPYDDYGMPHTACTNVLPEKTPFSMQEDWRNGACKAWEANVDATFDGNDNECGTNENWGSCGFQRHFPWNQINTEDFRNRNCEIQYDTGTGSRTLTDGCHCQGLGDALSGAVVCKTDGVETDCGDDDVQELIDQNKPKCYESDFLGRRNIQGQNLYITDANEYTSDMFDSVPPMSFSYDSTANGSTESVINSKLYNLAGVPFLGGVCKLFVPVPKQRITSVQIAGVHVNLDRSVVSSSVFAAHIGADDSFTQGTDQFGTAYCFSVVNPAEGMNNSNGIHNGNVAGGSVGDVNNVFNRLEVTGTSLTRQAGIEPAINFFDGTDQDHIGTQLEDLAADTINSSNPFGNGNPIAAGDSEVGANFDVVVHIHSEWCNSQDFWQYADMQLTGDFNDGNYDYPLNLAPGSPYDQRTAAAYDQTGALQLAQLRLDATAAATAYADGPVATFNGVGNCGADLADPANSVCLGEWNTYEAAYIAEQVCLATNGNDATQCTDEASATTDAVGVIANAGCMALLPNCNSDGNDGITEVTTLFGDAATTAHIAAAAAQAIAENFHTNRDFTHAHMDLMDKRNNMVADWNDVYQADPRTGYEGYLRFPHGDDDYFKDKDGVAQESAYAAATGGEYLRWPNAGAFAAFYSFVTCANPPYIDESDNADAPEVNRFSVIYNSGAVLIAPDDSTHDPAPNNQYDNYGQQNLKDRTLVMSQSDSDYRDENCDERVFRGNLRQVGYDVTVCGPGQLPDTDNKRCSWNWNYQSSSDVTVPDLGSDAWTAPSAQDPSDAEEWFDRNDPHSFDMWSTRKRRSEFENDRKYAFNAGYWGAQQGKTGETGQMWNGNVAFNADVEAQGQAIEIPITSYNFNLIFKTASGGSPAKPVSAANGDECFFANNADCVCRPSYKRLTGFQISNNAVVFDENYAAAVEDGGFDFTTFVAPNVAHASCADSTECTDEEVNNIKAQLQMDACDGYLTDTTGIGFKQSENIQTLVFDDSRIVSSLNHPANDEWEVAVTCDLEKPMNTLAANEAQRDYFPDCFFGDELWFTFTYSTDATNLNGINAMFEHNSYVSAWTTELKETGLNQQYV